jgi:hypothetical protein
VSALSDALRAPRTSANNMSCKFTQVVKQLDEDDQVTITDSVEKIRNDSGMGKSKQYSTSWMTKILRSFGFDISMSSVQRHVNKECSCERTGR